MPTLQLPPIEALDQAAAFLIAQGESQKLIDKALWALQSGLEIRTTTGGFLIPGSNGQTIYRISNIHGCSCPATKPCYHQAILWIVEEAQRHTMPRLTTAQRISAARAKVQMDELFA